MRGNLSATVWRLGAFLTVCAFFLFAMFAVFSQLRFEKENSYSAVFNNVSGLQAGQFVRIGGVEVGKVDKIVIQPDTTVVVDFGVDEAVVLTHGSRAVIRYDDLIGGRYLALEEGAGDARRLLPGQTIPLARTSPALDLDALVGGFRPLFRALDPDQVNALSSQLISAFQGQGDTINAFFTQTAALTAKLGDRDQLIGEVITNLNTVLGSLSDENTQFAKAVDALSQTVGTLAERKEDITNSIAYTDAAAGTTADLLRQAREPFKTVVAETDRTAGLVAGDKAYLDSLLSTLPSKYQTLSRFGLYGDYFSFYLCDAVLKVNGKGGQPVFIKLAGQDSGRCAPR
ncbi:MCE family protein [Mycolicibacterium confluentis]|uniref:Mce family protein Mce3B n=1 Tax=Mycolicibacterium confluentis TaxID=28047 RepID=A0A7I7Y529_9MYCO|nr:MCE family protein [Mycolicibacterium confluentis]MCV7319174.1 MCE family protein [Mycolicibacterium confluentis]ORV24886.1 mammalian cell entry protein [Mycolicibacterium confluentis]BBZ36788.1 Mce family protein Mce3B [Mycolicibacterium confluentis]